MGGLKSEWQMLLHDFNPTFIPSFIIVIIGLRNLKWFKIVLVLYQVCSVLYEPPVMLATD
jgi:hypothetical protein